ncbi:MAG: transporter substrate-binding domain-containing protein [Firmicutes bacterium]|nr:transporter substrate-binding domain-containing protein [Bacillota bacterium]
MSKNKFKKFFLVSLIGVLVLGLIACGSTTEKVDVNKQESQLEAIKASGKIVLGTSADYPPYEFHKEIDGKDEIVGFDIEIAKEIAKDLEVELVIKDMKFEGLLAALDSGNVDFVVAGMTPTPDREENVDFSKIYHRTVQALVVKKDNVENITSLQELEGKKIGAQKGSIQQEIATEQIPGGQIKALGKVSDLMLELKYGKIDAVVVEIGVAKAYVSKNSDLLVSEIKFDEEEGGSAVALKEGSTELVNAINNTLDRLMKEKLIENFVTKATELIE